MLDSYAKLMQAKAISLHWIFRKHPNSDDHGSEHKIEALTEIICRAGDEPETKSAALFVLMGTLENSMHSKVLANTVKHLAFTRCGELNLYGMVDAQIAVVEDKLLARDGLHPNSF